MTKRDVIVIGGGIAGLAAAHHIAATSGDRCNVRVIEASSRLGGKLDSVTLHGRTVDSSADGTLGRRPELMALLNELGHGDKTMPIAASGASVFVRGALRHLPKDLQLGIPTRWWSLAQSKTISKRGLLRALLDLVAPRSVGRGHLPDRAIGSLVERKLGLEVVNSLVDPMLGGIVAGRVSDLSAQALMPSLLAAAQKPGGLMKALRELAPTPETQVPPAFLSVEGGMYRLIELLTASLDSLGVACIVDTHVTGLHRQAGSDPAWMVDTQHSTYRADQVIVATPATEAAALCAPFDSELAEQLAAISYASVATITLCFPDHGITLPEYGTGVLIPPASAIPRGPRKGQRFLTTAVTFLDRKWPLFLQPGSRWIRASIGRIDDERFTHMTDDEIIAMVREELTIVFGATEAPFAASVTRWNKALPQYGVNHQAKIDNIANAVARHRDIALAGSYLEGVGVPACIASGRRAAAIAIRESTEV